jgi:hypothetical protein
LNRLLLSGTAGAASVGFLIVCLPASCAAAAFDDLLGPEQPLSELADHVFTVLMAPTMSLILTQRVITVAAVQLHCALSTGSGCRVLMSARLATCIPLDLHCEVVVSELLWSFFASFVDGCSRWQLSDGPSSAFTGAVRTHADVDSAPAAATNAIASKCFGKTFEG